MNCVPTIDKLKIINYNITDIRNMMRVSYFRLPVLQRAITKPLAQRIMKGERISGQPYRYDKGFLIDYPL